MSALSFPFRRQYFRMAMRSMREGQLAWLTKAGLTTLSMPVSKALGRPVAGPIMGNIVTTYRCNNACFMCDLPKPEHYEKRGGREFDTDEMKVLIDDFAAIGTVGLSFTGGEATIRPDAFELLSYAAKTGTFVHLNTNGYNLHHPSRVEALLETGIRSMNFSVDGVLAKTHNTLRNAQYGFERIERATELILRHRRNDTPAVTYTFVVGPDNFRQLPEFVTMARARGIESVSFNPLHAFYDGATPIPADTLVEMEAMMGWLREEKERIGGDFIDNSDAFLSLFPTVFRGAPSPLECSVPYHHVMVDCYGNIYSCAPLYLQSKPAANTRDISLREFWGSQQWKRTRDELSSCTGCVWNCHAEINILNQPRPVTSRGGTPSGTGES